LENTVITQKKKISDLEKKISDLYNNQNNFMEMLDKMNNLSFQILEEIKDLKERNGENPNGYIFNNNNYNNNTNFNTKYLTYDYNKHLDGKTALSNYRLIGNHKNLNFNAINETKAETRFSLEKTRNISSKYSKEKEPFNMRNNYTQYNLIENNFDNKVDRKSIEKTLNLYNYKDNSDHDNFLSNFNKRQTYSRSNTQNNINSNNNINNYSNLNYEKNNINNVINNNSFYTNKFSNFNNNLLGEGGDDDTIYAISNDINNLRNNLKENNKSAKKEKLSYGKNMEITPSFFKNEKLFNNFDINEKTIKKNYSSYDYGFFGIRCRDPLDSSEGKYYFNVHLQTTNKSNIFIGITSDPRMAVPGGYHKSHNTFMYNLSNSEAYVRTTSQTGNFARKGRAGDIYTFYVDFELKIIKLFLNGNELNSNNITIYTNENKFYPCIDLKDVDDSVSFVDRIILNFNN